MSAEAWAESGEAWTRWVRGPAADRYEPFTDALLGILPPPPARVLDLGCGEGAFARILAGQGYTVTGVDIAAAAVRHAAEADPAGTYVEGDMCALPFAPGTFDLTVARISLQDVDDLDCAVAEAARVLASGGSLCAAVFHPVCAGGRIDGEQFVVDRYFDEGPWVTTHDADGLPLTIHSHRRALGTYLRAIGDAGLAVQTVSEKAFPGPLSAVPLVLAIRAGKP